MDLLLDTHALIWWIAGSDRLSAPARKAIEDEANPVFVSAATGWEITTKHRLGRLPDVSPIVLDLSGVLADQGFARLPISFGEACRAGLLDGPSRDPFDRMLIAQAQLNDLVLVSLEPEFSAYGVRVCW